jgi:UDP-N-acetylmuramoyl-tripeptide--D-alanyl-D-alanine ligase
MSDAAGSLFGIGEILAAAGGTLFRPASAAGRVSSVAVDSRTVQPGALFVALVGERADGHDFAAEAAGRGAAALLVEGGKAARVAAALDAAGAPAALIAVDSPLAALHLLARRHLEGLPGVTRVGVTGSSGKTTTKEIIGAVLRTAGPAAVNEGNLNSEIGLPIACFAVRAAHRHAVFEMGMNHAGEMAALAEIVRPDLALITNIGTAHVGLLGSRDAIAREKKAVFSRFDGPQTGFLNEAEPYREALADGVRGKIVLFGPRSTRGFEGSESLGLDGTLIHWEGSRVRFPLFGPHNLANALAAVSVAREIGLSPADIRRGLESVHPLFGRSEIIRGPVTVVFDGYNANPDSMEQALGFLEELPWAGRKIAVLGGMRELGEAAAAAHAALGRRLAGSRLDAVLLFGEEMEAAWRPLSASPRAASASWTADFETLAARAGEVICGGDLLLIKGSRGMELERLLPFVTGERVRVSRCS